MGNHSDTPSSTKQLAELFVSIKNVEIIPWQDDSDAIGLSILKDYPDKSLFVPTLNKKGEKDSVSMIRIWYLIKDVIEENNSRKVKLNIAIIKSSRYIFDHHFYIFEDEDSPTKTSIAISKASRQPIDLEENSRYELQIDSLKIYDLKKDKYVSSKEVVEEIYKEHLNTLTNLFFQLKMMSRDLVVNSIDPINKFLKKINYYLFNKGFKKTNDFGTGILTPYPLRDLEDLTPPTERLKILGSNFPISYKTSATFVTFFSIVFFLRYYYNFDFLGIVKFINSLSSNFFITVLTIAMLLFFDRGIPYSILYLINQLIKLKWYLATLKIKV